LNREQLAQLEGLRGLKCVVYVSDIILYSICSGILSMCSVLRTVVMWWYLGVLGCSTGESILNSLQLWRFISVTSILRKKRIAVDEQQ